MAERNLSKIVDIIHDLEGGWKEPDPFDPNPTYKGVIQKTYDRYRQKKGQLPRHVLEISDDEWLGIFRSMFWNPSGSHEWQWPLDLCTADFAFHSGPARPVRNLQDIVGVTPDGVYGPDTLKAVSEQDPRQLAIRLNGRRLNWWRWWYDDSVAKGLHPSKLPPLRGWENRLKKLQKAMN